MEKESPPQDFFLFFGKWREKDERQTPPGPRRQIKEENKRPFDENNREVKSLSSLKFVQVRTHKTMSHRKFERK
jgi:hypothetical protein